ncbi:MAG TPA: 2-dehydropantoate 2-reductase [Candidatus Acidoferrales bacterium]|nr:2-dehydropantoate 2-reductase [Candidatus Acidoferrales bacterium]
MRIAVMGTGAVGGYFGAKLAAAKNEVSFVARGAHLEAMRRHGLTVASPEGDLHVTDAVFTSDPAEIGVVDLVLFCVKSYDTVAASTKIAPLIGQETLTLALQNGVDNADKIAQITGNKSTLAGVVYLGAQLARPGVIKFSAGGRIIFGQLDGEVRTTTRSIAQMLAAAKIACEISPEIRKAQWRKLLWNAPFCAISCLVRGTVGEIIESESLRQLAVDCMLEVREAAATQSIDLEPALLDETLQFSKSLGDFKPSMLQDLEAGRPLEYEAFNGIVIDILRRAGKSAPTSQVFYGALKFLDERIRKARVN